MNKKSYRVIVGCNVPHKDGEKRYEPGDKLKESDEKIIKALLELECIEEINGRS